MDAAEGSRPGEEMKEGYEGGGGKEEEEQRVENKTTAAAAAEAAVVEIRIMRLKWVRHDLPFCRSR